MTVQIALKLPESLLVAVDQLVADGEFANRSAAVRAALVLMTRDARETAIDRGFDEGFRNLPESESELADAYRLAIESIEDEPWERWW